uniref:DUF4279 domain-containing protein n=1 Tax=Salinispora arenicola (strain CNS-205) TaxID=391037 RepID=A8LVS0_SALAI
MERSVGVDSSQVAIEAQRAAFVVSSELMSVAQITSIMGYQADFSLAKGAIRQGARARIPARRSSWEIRETADSITEAIENLLRRLRPVRDELRELRNLGCSARFSIVQQVVPDSDLGFAIDVEDVRLLADVGALIDVDQYIEF